MDEQHLIIFTASLEMQTQNLQSFWLHVVVQLGIYTPILTSSVLNLHDSMYNLISKQYIQLHLQHGAYCTKSKATIVHLKYCIGPT